jgi:hypothetical protein
LRSQAQSAGKLLFRDLKSWSGFIVQGHLVCGTCQNLHSFHSRTIFSQWSTDLTNVLVAVNLLLSEQMLFKLPLTVSLLLLDAAATDADVAVSS